MMPYTDFDGVKLIRQGDVRAFEQAFHGYAEALVRYAVTFLKDQDEAEDIVQQLFVQVWTKRESLDVKLSLKSYLYKAVHNSCLNKLKQQGVRKAYASDYLATTDGLTLETSHVAEQKEVERAIENAIAELPEQCGIVFRKSRFEQLKYQEIADEMGISVKTVENQMGKALKYMRVKLKDFITVLIVYFTF